MSGKEWTKSQCSRCGKIFRGLLARMLSRVMIRMRQSELSDLALKCLGLQHASDFYERKSRETDHGCQVTRPRCRKTRTVGKEKKGRGPWSRKVETLCSAHLCFSRPLDKRQHIMGTVPSSILLVPSSLVWPRPLAKLLPTAKSCTTNA